MRWALSGLVNGYNSAGSRQTPTSANLSGMSTMSAAAGIPSPDLFFDAAFAYARTEALRTAVELDLFSAIAAGRQTVAELARECAAAEKGVRVLCDYLVVAGFLRKQQGRYVLTPDSAMFL